MQVVFTDLDGTLLDPATYGWKAARPALEKLERAGVPVVFATSKTRAEAEWWRRRMGNRHPFVVENGGAVIIPCGYFETRIPGARRDGAYDVVELGTPYPELLAVLHAAAAESRVEVHAFHQMTAGEIAAACGLPLELASLAKLRWYDEPFQVTQGASGRLAEAIERRGKRCTQGGRFHHITGTHDKLTAVHILRALYARAHEGVFSVGIGDHWNDVPFLNAMDVPVLMDPPEPLRAAVPRALVASPAGPRAWSEAVLRLLAG
jgi:mannosyl-3-phosphoglycerate phosphatase